MQRWKNVLMVRFFLSAVGIDAATTGWILVNQLYAIAPQEKRFLGSIKSNTIFLHRIFSLLTINKFSTSFNRSFTNKKIMDKLNGKKGKNKEPPIIMYSHFYDCNLYMVLPEKPQKSRVRLSKSK